MPEVIAMRMPMVIHTPLKLATKLLKKLARRVGFVVMAQVVIVNLMATNLTFRGA